MNSICPFDVQHVKPDVSLTYLLSIKKLNNTYFSFSCYDGKHSAFIHFIAQSGQIQDESDRKALKEFKKNYCQNPMSENGEFVIEGKEHMSFKCYQQACKLLIKDGSPDLVFTLCFLTLQWNLILRLEATEHIFFKQVKWKYYRLKIYFPKHISDQIGLNKDVTRYVYSNANDPSVCLLHAFASYLLIFPSIFVDGRKLFPGKDQKKRFNTCLHRVTKSNSHVYEVINVKTEELGSHSICKGTANYCCAGVHLEPPIVSVCLRTGWTVGRVKERYLKYKNAGDELVGRTLTGIPQTGCDFGISPVYFKQTTGNSKDTDEFVSLVFSIEHSILISLSHVLLATFIFHEEWTIQMIPPTCLLAQSLYFAFCKHYPNRFSFVETSLPWQNDPDSRVITRIPIH